MPCRVHFHTHDCTQAGRFMPRTCVYNIPAHTIPYAHMSIHMSTHTIPCRAHVCTHVRTHLCFFAVHLSAHMSTHTTPCLRTCPHISFLAAHMSVQTCPHTPFLAAKLAPGPSALRIAAGTEASGPRMTVAARARIARCATRGGTATDSGIGTSVVVCARLYTRVLQACL